MKKIIVILALIFIFVELFGVSEFGCIFILNNPSAKGIAFGADSGASDIWDTSPLGVWSNPAKLGYHKGFAFCYSHDPCFEEVFDDIYIRSSYISFGWKGLGILLPMYSAKKHFGTVMSYGEQERTDEFGNVLGTFESYDACSKFALGINSLEFVSNFITNESIRSLQCYGDLSVGFNYDIIHSELAPQGAGEIPDSLPAIADAHSTGIGLIGRISPFNKMNALGGFCTLDIIGGIYYVNPTKEEVSYSSEEDQSDPLPWGTHSAFSGKLAIMKETIPLLSEIPIFDDFVDNLFSVYYSQDKTLYGDKDENNPGEWGEGMEFTFLDILSVRDGYYKNKAGEVEGETFGIGVNLNYRDLFQFQYNYSETHNGGLVEKQDKWDILFRADFVALYNMFNS